MGSVSRLLIVEDEPGLRKVLGDYYGSLGLRVAVAGSVAAARQLLSEQFFDAFVIDVQLPDGDGMSLLGPVPPNLTLAMTSKPDPERFAKLGIRYLPKPFNLSALTHEIQEILESGSA